jgi:hypothetical protein
MECHRGYAENVDGTPAFRVILFLITGQCILLSTSIRHVSAKIGLVSTYLLLMLVFPVARILTH